MVLSAQDAAKIISQNPHANCRSGLRRHFRDHIYQDEHGRDQVKAQSICWLYCWATTGRGSAKAARQAREAFNQMFEPGYDWLPPKLLDTARELRYKTRDVEQEFLAAIIRHTPSCSVRGLFRRVASIIATPLKMRG